MAKIYSFPDDLDELRNDITEAMMPITPASKSTNADKDFLFSAQRTDASTKLPEYYLCYFLFVDLLGYRNLGQYEKISWSVPIDYMGDAYLLEHRKFGMGLFAKSKTEQQEETEKIVYLINKAVNIAKPFFEWKAQEYAKASELNVVNNH